MKDKFFIKYYNITFISMNKHLASRMNSVKLTSPTLSNGSNPTDSLFPFFIAY